MELQLDTLITKIKTNGIEEGKRSADEIVSNAKKQADEIVRDAQSKAKEIVDNANVESATLLSRGKDALKQAERDLLLTLEGKLKELSDKFLRRSTEEALSADKLSELIKTALASWDFGSDSNIFVHLSEHDAKQVSVEAISGSLQSSNSVEIKIDNGVQQGFRISRSDTGYAFDFTAEAVSEALSVFLTPNVLELLR